MQSEQTGSAKHLDCAEMGSAGNDLCAEGLQLPQSAVLNIELEEVGAVLAPGSDSGNLDPGIDLLNCDRIDLVLA